MDNKMETLNNQWIMPAMAVRPCIYMEETIHRQVRFPRSRKKRIRRKWAKNKRNWKYTKVPMDRAYIVDGVLYCHPSFAKKLGQEFAIRAQEKFLKQCSEPPGAIFGLPPFQNVINMHSATQSAIDFAAEFHRIDRLFRSITL